MTGGKECIDKIEVILRDLGLRSTLRLNERKLKATVEPKQGVRYSVYFLAQNERIFIEAVVSKSVSGGTEFLNLFYETLLTYNSSVSPFSFAQVQLPDGSKKIILRYTLSCHNVEAFDLKFSILALNEAFVMHIPRIKDLADEYHLKFSGQGDFNVADIVKAIIGID